MKWLHLILAIYISSLCFYPCKDNGDHEAFSVQKIKDSKSCNEHHDENCCHHCSPFCFCNCCQVNTVVSLSFEFHQISTLSKEIITEYVEHSIPEIYYQIWQPPKI
ncbi:MAG TPA: hypothetical protein PKK00_02305 [Bacteroidales bacterium]|nr:hypothetical protein [Bacteroidales bacterium]HPS15739.1 hypothetical protein [Bacteroidales bacterium]